MNIESLVTTLLGQVSDIVRVNSYIVVRGLAYVSCSLKTMGSYYLVYEDGSISYKTSDKIAAKSGYISAYNRGIIGKLEGSSYTDVSHSEANLFEIGVGDAIVILDLETGSIVRSLYFKDTYNMPCPVEIIKGDSDDFLALSYSEYCYILKTDDHFIHSYPGTNIHIFEDYLIRLPYCGYDEDFCDCSIVNTITWNEIFIGEEIKKNFPDTNIYDISINPALITKKILYQGYVRLNLLISGRNNNHLEITVTDTSFCDSKNVQKISEESFARIRNAYREVKRINTLVEQHINRQIDESDRISEDINETPQN